MKPLVSIQSLTLKYRGRNTPALDDITINITRGEKILVLGPSGCGKSTLLQAISGVIPELIPATLDGKIKKNYSNLGVLLQNPKTQMISTTVEEEIAFPLENQGISPSIIREKVDKAIREFGLEYLRFRKSNSLSGGETQKVALISAVISQPEILLLDEPTSYLDSVATADLLGIIRGLPEETAILIVEHRWDIFIHYVGRVIIFNERGKIIFDDCSKKFLANKNHYFEEPGIWNLEGLLHNYRYAMNKSLSPSSKGTPIIRTEKLTYCYHNTQESFHLSNINISFKTGETTVILGNNGAGKTTLIENIAAFFKETFKYILLQETPYSKLNMEQIYSNINYVPQNPEYLFLKERVIDELNYNTGSNGNSSPIFDWSNKLYANPFSLSEGEKRRLSLSILFNDPRKIIIMDEPTYGLDFKAYITLIEALKMLRTKNIALVIVSHDINFAQIVADQIVLMERGRVIFKGMKAEFIKSKLYSKLIYQRENFLKETIN